MIDRRRAPLAALTTLGRRPRIEAGSSMARPVAQVQPTLRSRVVDNAVYSAGRRVATPSSAAESRAELDLGGGPPRLAGALPPGAAGTGRAGRALRPARTRRRGRHQGPPAAEVRAV